MRKMIKMVKEMVKKTKIGMLLADTRGMGTIEVILIIVVLIGLVLIFKDQITDIVESLFGKVTSGVNKM